MRGHMEEGAVVWPVMGKRFVLQPLGSSQTDEWGRVGDMDNNKGSERGLTCLDTVRSY